MFTGITYLIKRSFYKTFFALQPLVPNHGETTMKKLLLALLASLAFSISAFAAVNINTATQAELESLDGIGPVKAAAIIDYRKKNGGFKSVDELEKVDGVGPVTLANVKKDVSVSGATSVPAATTKTADKPAAKDMKKDASAKETKAEKAAPVKEMAKKDSATPTATVKVDDKEAAKLAKEKEKADKKAAADAKKADKAVAKDTKAEKSAAATDTSKADAKAAKNVAKAEKKAAADKVKADKKAAADAKKAEKSAEKAKTEKK